MEKKNKREQEEPLEKLLFDTKMDRYWLVNVAAKYVRLLKEGVYGDEYKEIPYYKLVDVALRDILSGKVKIEDIISKKMPPKKQK